MSSMKSWHALPALVLLPLSPAFAQPVLADLAGPYVGIEGGAVNHHFVVEETSTSSETRSRNVSKWGVGGGVFAGYDANVTDRLRLGGEAAFNFGGRTPSTSIPGGERLAIKPRYGFSLTARAGYAVTATVRPYVGVGYGGHRYRTDFPADIDNFGRWNRSFILLAGVELKALPKANVRIEFMHLDGTRNQVMVGVPIRF